MHLWTRLVPLFLDSLIAERTIMHQIYVLNCALFNVSGEQRPDSLLCLLNRHFPFCMSGQQFFELGSAPRESLEELVCQIGLSCAISPTILLQLLDLFVQLVNLQ